MAAIERRARATAATNRRSVPAHDPAVPTAPPSTVARHELDALVGSDRDGTPPGRGALPPRPRRRARARRRRRARGVPRLPDVPGLRLAVLAHLGEGGPGRPVARLRRVPRADRASAAAARRARAGAVRRRRGAGVRRALPGRDGGAAGRDVPVRQARRGRARWPGRRRPAAHALQLRPAGLEGLSRHPVLRARDVGDGARGREAAPRRGGVVAARTGRAAAPRGVAARRPLRTVAWKRRDRPAPEGAAPRGGGAGDLGRARLRRHRRPAVLDPSHGRARGRAPARHPAAAVCPA